MTTATLPPDTRAETSVPADSTRPAKTPTPIAPALDADELRRLGQWFQWVPGFAVTRGDVDVLHKLDANVVAQMPDGERPAETSRFGPRLRLIRGGRGHVRARTLEETFAAMATDALELAPTGPPKLRLVR